MAKQSITLEGQTVLVSGAGRGIGRACAEAAAAAGATVALTARTESQVEEAAAAIRASGGSAHGFRADVGEIETHDALLDRIESTCGSLSGLVNIAGIAAGVGRAERVRPEDFDAVYRINQRGTFFMTQAVAKRWIAQSVGGAVVSLSSIAARVGVPQNLAYSMSRAAVEGMTVTLAGEWSHAVQPPIRVNCVAPGWIETELTADLPAWYMERCVEHTALRRMGNAEEVAGAVVFLLSDAARFITGETIEVSGGYGIWSVDRMPAKQG